MCDAKRNFRLPAGEPWTTKNFVALSPFSNQDIQVKTTVDTGGKKYGVARVENLSSMVELEVIFSTEDGRFSPGDRVLVSGDLSRSPWAAPTVVQDFNGRRYMIAPVEIVRVVLPPKKAPEVVP